MHVQPAHAGQGLEQPPRAAPWGLDWVASFAAAQGVPVVIPEWALDIGSGGLGDDPTFVENVASWVAGHDVAWTCYFNYDVPGGRHDLLDGWFPKSLAAFRSAHFGTVRHKSGPDATGGAPLAD